MFRMYYVYVYVCGYTTVQIKSKVDQSREKSSARPYTSAE